MLYLPVWSSNFYNFLELFHLRLLQLWDIRKLDNCIQHFVAHIGPTFSIDWHPDEADWLGTAGRDKLIKVRTDELTTEVLVCK